MAIHKPVLLKETIELLNLKNGDVVVDATLGGGGHSREILKKINNKGTLIAFDLDINAINKLLAEIPNDKSQIPNKFQIPIYKIQNIFIVNGNFNELKKILEILIIKKVNAILADLGWSSDQLEGKGMSFQKDEELDMRLNPHQELSAKKIINEYPERDLIKILREYGEEKYAHRIAKEIINNRKIKPIKTAFDLVKIIENSVPEYYKHRKIHPATKTFQALRIEVNNELENLEKFIPQAINSLKREGRLAIISFHSLEDRIVKNMFRENARGSILTDEITGRHKQTLAPKIKLITKKPIMAAQNEVLNNPRSRSAKFRVIEKL